MSRATLRDRSWPQPGNPLILAATEQQHCTMNRGARVRHVSILSQAAGPTLVSVAANLVVADTAGASPEVKRSRSGICHVKGQRGYDQTVCCIAFGSLEACPESGGRLPGQKAHPGDTAPDGKAAYDTEDTSIVKKSRSGVCHDKKSSSFAQVKNFTACKTMQDCLDSGGREPGR